MRWKTYLGLPEADRARRLAMGVLGNGLYLAHHHEDALSVKETELSMERRLGVSEDDMLYMQNNLGETYRALGQDQHALRLKQDVYSGRVKLNGEEHEITLVAASNYAVSLRDLRRFEEAKSLLRKTMPVARRVLGKGDQTTLRMRWVYAQSLCGDANATLDDLREAVTMLEELERTARRVFGAAHPITSGIESSLQVARRRENKFTI